MNKKYLKHLVTASFLSISLLSLSGCANTPIPNEDNNSEIIIKENTLVSEDNSIATISFTKREKEISALEYTLLNYKKGIYKLEDLSFKLKHEDNVDTEFTLPWFIGPIINMNKNDYLLNLYTNKGLLELGFGIGDRISLYYLVNAKKYVPKGMTLNTRLLELGYYNPKDLYKEIFTKLTSYSTVEIYSMLRDLESKGILDISNILNSSKIEANNNKLINSLYHNYFKFENDLNINKVSTLNLSEKWTIRLENTEVTLSNNDYLIYTLSFMIMNKILENAPLGEKLNAI